MSSQEAFEAVTEEVAPTLAFKLDFEGIGVSLINRRLIEVVYLTVQQLKFEYSSSPVAQSVNLSVGSLQIDNQLHDGAFPVVLQPTPLSRELKNAAALPTVQGSVIWLNDQGRLSLQAFSTVSHNLLNRARRSLCQVLLHLAAGAYGRG